MRVEHTGENNKFLCGPSLTETVQHSLALGVQIALGDLRQTVDGDAQEGLAPGLQRQAQHHQEH